MQEWATSTNKAITMPFVLNAFLVTGGKNLQINI
jgi:hypothetical protein